MIEMAQRIRQLEHGRGQLPPTVNFVDLHAAAITLRGLAKGVRPNATSIEIGYMASAVESVLTWCPDESATI